MQVGEQLPARTFRVTRADLVRYAGASGDFNPIHWSDRAATAVGLPGVIAHGMYTMALAGRALTEWAGAADAVLDYRVRFSRPVPVPDDDEGAQVEVTGVVRAVDSDTAEIEISAACGGQRILAQAKATVRLPEAAR